MTKINYSEIPLVNNNSGDKKQFEIVVEDKTAYMEYMLVRGNVLYLTHTEVPVGLEGKGVGSNLVQKVLAFARENDFLIAPLCPFLASYLNKHPQDAQGILAPGYKIG